MPTYTYKCPECGYIAEETMSVRQYEIESKVDLMCLNNEHAGVMVEMHRVYSPTQFKINLPG